MRALDAARLPVWLSLERQPQSIDWLERRGKRLRVYRLATDRDHPLVGA